MTPCHQRGSPAENARLDQAGHQEAFFKVNIMKTFVVDKYKKKGALRLAEMPEPNLLDTDVLVEVHAAGVNPLDSKVRDGEFKLILPYRPPFILGHDVAGTVVRVGSKVRNFKPGHEVYARPRDGRIGAGFSDVGMTGSRLAGPTSEKPAPRLPTLLTGTRSAATWGTADEQQARSSREQSARPVSQTNVVRRDLMVWRL